jgi:PAS domain S-box-containing protein
MAMQTLMSSEELMREIEKLRAKLAEAKSKLAQTENQLAEAREVLQAIQSGEVDAVVVSRPEGDQVYTLQGAEYAYRALVEAMNEGAAMLGADGTVLYCNQRFAGILGLPLEQIIGNPVSELAAPQAKHNFEALLAQARNGVACKAELEFLPGDSGLIPVQVSLGEMKTVAPSTLSMVVSDLTERKKRDDLIAAGRLATSILESAAEAIAVCDEIGMIIHANEALENLCGFNPIFQRFESALPLEETGGAAGSLKYLSISEALRGGTLRSKEVRLIRDHSHPVSLLLTASAIKASSGFVGCVFTMADITERKQAEEALIRSEKLASVGRMAASIAHEINNPLAAVVNTLYLARTNAEDPEFVRRNLDVADDELMRIAHITRQTLGFYRESSAPAAVSVGSILDAVVDLLRGKIRAKGAIIERQCDDGLRVLAVPGEMRQIFSNLLLNSLDAIGHKGTIKLRASKSTSVDSNRPRIRVTVADNGKGIDASILPRIFEPLFTTNEATSSGLGLWVSKQLIDKNGGFIRVRSSTNSSRRGAVFTVVLPAAS